MSETGVASEMENGLAQARGPRAAWSYPAILVETLETERDRWFLWLPVIYGAGVAGYFSLLSEPPLLVAVMPVLLALAFRLVFRRDLAETPGGTSPPGGERPVFVLVVLGLTLAGFAVTSFAGWSPAWAALTGAVVLGVRSLAQRRSTIGGITRSLHLPFCLFVLALAVVVKAVMVNGLDSAARDLLPAGSGLAALLGIAALAAVLSNAVNNLPAVLVLLPLVSGPPAVLAVLIGVNIGPNLTYVGSLANLLWRRVLHHHGEATSAGEFSRLGLLTVPVCLVVAVVALWAGVRLMGV